MSIRVGFGSSGLVGLRVCSPPHTEGESMRIGVEGVVLDGVTRRSALLRSVSGHSMGTPCSIVRVGRSTMELELVEAELDGIVFEVGDFVELELVSRRSPTVSPPSDLVEALNEAGLKLSDVDERLVRHMVSMVREAGPGAIRQSRVHDIIEFLEDNRVDE